MTPSLIAKILIAQYLVLAVAYGISRDFPRTLYWIGASIIASSVLVMK